MIAGVGEVCKVGNKKYIEACILVQEIVGDFVCMSRNSPEEVNMADDLMRLQNLLLEMYEED